MTKEQLEQYINLKAELAELQYKLQHVGEGDSLIGNDVINDYRTGYGRPQTVIGPDWDRLSNRVQRYTKMIDKVRGQCEEIEQFMEDIRDSQLRRIFRMRYADGLKQKSIAKKLNIDRSYVSKKIDDYLKLSHNSH